MILKNTKTYTADSRRVSAQDLNTFGQLVRIFNNVTGRYVFVDAAGIHFREPLAATETLVARLTGSPSDGVYDWKAVGPMSDGTFGDVAGGRDSDNSGKAIPTTSTQTFNTDATTGDVVVLRRSVELDTGTPVWVIIGSASLPAGQYDGMLLQNTAQLTWGAGYMRLTNAPPT